MLLISFVSAVVFSVLDSSVFLFGEITLQEKIKTTLHVDNNIAELITGGMSSAVAIFIFTFIKIHLSKRYKIIDNPFIDAIGILIGTTIMIFLYILLR